MWLEPDAKSYHERYCVQVHTQFGDYMHDRDALLAPKVGLLMAATDVVFFYVHQVVSVLDKELRRLHFLLSAPLPSQELILDDLLQLLTSDY